MTVINQEVKKEKIEEAIYKLRTLGLSESEVKVYVYLLEKGIAVGGSKIAIGAKIHRQYVYSAIPSLLDFGLIEEVPHGKQNKYIAKSPNELEKIARKVVVDTEDIVRELKKISKVGNEQDFDIIVGADNIRRYEVERARSIPRASTQYIIGGTSKYFIDALGESYEAEYAPLLKKKEVVTKFIGIGEQKDYLEYLSEQRKYFEIRILSQMKSRIVNFMISENNVYFYTFINPPTLYVIKSEAVATGYLELFNIMWGLAEDASRQAE